MVVVFHAFSFAPQTGNQKVAMLLLQSLSLGVPLFFILSGFLISQIIFLQQGRFSVTSYTIRRIARIAPAFLASILLYLVLSGSILQDPLKAGSLVVQNLLSLPNFLQNVRMINPVSWSLFVEIHFYILFPCLFFLFRKSLPHSAGWATILAMVGVSVICRALAWNLPAETLADRFFLINRFPGAMDYFCWGILYSLFLKDHQTSTFHRKADYFTLTGLALMLSLLVYFTIVLTMTGEPSHFSRWWIHESVRLGISVAAFLMLFTTHLSGHGLAYRLFGSKTLRYIGIVSYEWFLIHLAIIPRVRFRLLDWMNAATEFPSPLGNSSTAEFVLYLITTAVGVVVSFIAAAALHRWFSVPSMNLMRRQKPV
jgi:peptidoglycan/LPS O-acetylase OafA/YrhL